jgi:hypothetical protein
MILYVSPMSQEGNFHFLKFCECLTNHQRGNDVRKMLLCKRNHWNCMKKKSGGKSAVFFKYSFCTSNYLCAYVCCTLYM